MKRLLSVLIVISVAVLIYPFSAYAIFTKLPTPVLDLTVGWDDSGVNAPALIFDSNNYYLWYGGIGDLGKWQIGLVNSSSPTNFTRDLVNPVIAWNIVSPNGGGVQHPTILKTLQNKYLMWFNTVSSDNQTFELYFSQSNDGVNWDLPIPLEFDNNTTTWDSQSRTAPSVIYDPSENIYKMWFSARGFYNNTQYWRIGYATSQDGVHWSKNPFPVLDIDQLWEIPNIGVGVANPDVIYVNGIYHMWYHVRGIGYAISPDGINWTKFIGNPILTATANTFDTNGVYDAFVLAQGSTFYLYYTGIGPDGNARIGLATDTSLPTIPITITPSLSPTSSLTSTPSLTPTENPTLTPTPTITVTPTSPITATPAVTTSPTLSPTPTATPFSPIIIVPGIGASWSPSLLSCSTGISHLWSVPKFVHVYNRLLDTLDNGANLERDEDFYLYAYDWRHGMDTQADSFANYIEQVLSSHPFGTKVRIVAHSMGGLLTRSYLEKYSHLNRVERVMTVGTPHQGAALAYPVWEAAEVWSDDLLFKHVMLEIVHHCRRVLQFIPPYKTDRLIVQQVVPSVRDLLPTYDFLQKNNAIVPYLSMNQKNSWIIDHPFPPSHYGIDFETLSGNGKKTTQLVNVSDPTSADILLGNWIDGKAKKLINEPQDAGDGTVLNTSSTISSLPNEIINGEHSQILSSEVGLGKILDFLGLSSTSLAQVSALPETTSTAILSVTTNVPALLTAADPTGQLVEGENGLTMIYDPQAGVYTIKLRGTGSGTGYVHIQSTRKNSDTVDGEIVVEITPGQMREFLLPYNPKSNAPLSLISL